MIIKLPKIHSLGSSYTKHVLYGDIEITGKLDGSQFRIYKPSEGSLVYGSRNCTFNIEKDYNKSFKPPIDMCEEVKDELLKNMPVGCTCFAEYIGKRNQHKIHYFSEVDLRIFNYYYEDKWYPADWIRLPFSRVKQLYVGETDIVGCMELMKQIDPTPYLRNDCVTMPDEDRIEGIVIKNYDPDFPSYSERFAKLVHLKFREAKSKMFPLSQKEHKKEQHFLDYTVTRNRGEKLVWYLKETDPEFNLSMGLMPKLIPLTLEDILKEEIVDWLLKKNPDTFHYKEFKKAIGGKVAHYLGLVIHDWLKEGR